MLGSPIAEQPGFLAIRAEAEVGYCADTGPFEPFVHIADEVEMRLA
jgi:ribonuclease BN (tRNA processing enzyme)